MQMRIVVLNGSPKGALSVTMQYVQYMQGQCPGAEFKIIHITQQIRKIETDEGYFREIAADIKASDGVLWAFPLYVCLVHAGYMRFIELIWERDAQEAFAGKYTTALSTSIKFFDHTAHNYIRAVCDDLGMKYAGFFSASMDDLLTESNRTTLARFAADFLESVGRRLPTQRMVSPVRAETQAYEPGPAGPTADNGGLRTLLVTDEDDGDDNLKRMTARFVSAFAAPVDVIRLSQAKINGGCLGCIHCGYDNECVYDGSDDIREIYDGKIRNADIVVFAGAMRGRFLSARFKTFIDRRFFMTHQPQMTGKQIAYIVSGALSQNANAAEVLQAIAELDRANLAGIVSDECGSAELDALLDGLAGRLVANARAKYVRPATFLGVGGMKIFRDEIYGPLRFVFRKDHAYYRKHGFYDFPQKQWKVRLTNAFMTLLMKITPVRKQIQKDMAQHMAKPFQKVVTSGTTR
jgi:multimeric flavodoxin WrbA